MENLKNNVMRKAMLFVILFFASGMLCAKAADTIQSFENGRINWSKGFVYAWGSATVDPSVSPYRLSRELAERNAIIKAKENLIDILKQVKLDSKISVEDLSSKIKLVGAKISNAAKVADIKNELIRDDLVRTTVTLKIYGNFSQSLLPYTKETRVEKNPDEALIEELRERQAMRVTSQSPKTPVAVVTGKYSGLIIDARHTKTTPVMFPKITDESGKEIYSFSKLSVKNIPDESFVLYTKDIKSALSNPKAGTRPLVLRALIKIRTDESGIILSNKDSRKIEYENKKSKFLDAGNVIIVLD